MFCPLGNHLLRGLGVFITNPRHIRFLNKFFPDYLPSEKVCAKCKQDIEIAYEYKMKRLLASKAYNGSLISSLSSDESPVQPNEANKRNVNVTNVQKRSIAQSASSSTDDSQPTTSAQAAAKRLKRQEHKSVQQQKPLAINIQRGARLPHVQPVARRHQFVHANPDIMDIYISGTTGG